MANISRDQLIDLFILNSPRLAFHRMIAFTRPKIHPFVLENCEYISVDSNLVHDFIKCKICHRFCRFTKNNRFGMIQHLENMHKLHNPNKKSTKDQQCIQTENQDSKKKIHNNHSDKYQKMEKVVKTLKHQRKLANKCKQKEIEVCARAEIEGMEEATVDNSLAMPAV